MLFDYIKTQPTVMYFEHTVRNSQMQYGSQNLAQSRSQTLRRVLRDDGGLGMRLNLARMFLSLLQIYRECWPSTEKNNDCNSNSTLKSFYQLINYNISNVTMVVRDPYMVIPVQLIQCSKVPCTVGDKTSMYWWFCAISRQQVCIKLRDVHTTVRVRVHAGSATVS